jgi:hypothetical protein
MAAAVKVGATVNLVVGRADVVGTAATPEGAARLVDWVGRVVWLAAGADADNLVET